MYRVTAKFFFDNGQVKRVDWVEKGLTKKAVVDGEEKAVPLTLEEAEHNFRLLFLRYMKTGDVLTIPNILGEISVVPFAKVHYATVKVASNNPADYATEEDMKFLADLLRDDVEGEQHERSQDQSI
jgi:hypothetical protein